MEDKEICVSLTHYENSDYKCDNSVLRLRLTKIIKLKNIS